MQWPKKATIKEVGPRDGLQNEREVLSTEHKIAWINQLSQTGLNYIEITSFVNPKWIPALADAYEVATQIERHEGVTYAALVPNQRGLERALEADIDEISIFMSASETHNKKNINKTIDETYPILKAVVEEALAANKTVRGYVSTAFGCPYEGKVAPHSVVHISEKLFEMGIHELSIGDTLGVATPKQVQDLLTLVLKQFRAEQIAMHFHDTRGTAMANIITSLDMGITTFDSSLGGLGGCPYAPGAAGNLASDDLLYMLKGMGIHTGVSEEKLMQAAQFIQKKIGRPLASRQLQTITSC